MADTRHSDPTLFCVILIVLSVIAICNGLGVYYMSKSSIWLSNSFFKQLVSKVFNAPINLYFDKNPTGVILNRFSRDLNVVDNALPFTVRTWMQFLLQAFAIIAIAAYNIIWILLVVPILGIV